MFVIAIAHPRSQDEYYAGIDQPRTRDIAFAEVFGNHDTAQVALTHLRTAWVLLPHERFSIQAVPVDNDQ